MTVTGAARTKTSTIGSAGRSALAPSLAWSRPDVSSASERLTSDPGGELADVRMLLSPLRRIAADTVRGVPERRASCSCGQLQAVVTGDPVRVSICHCLACQRRTGSSYGYQSRFPAQSVTISGQSKQFIRHSDEDAEIRSGPSPTRLFRGRRSRSGRSASTVGSWSRTRLSTSTEVRRAHDAPKTKAQRLSPGPL